jgi:hypothetical protein
MPGQNSMWEIIVAILVPLLVMSAALLMERVERYPIASNRCAVEDATPR